MKHFNIHLSVAKDYTTTPGGRARTDGKYSAEQFYDEHLHRAMYDAIQKKVHLFVNLDGTEGYAASFLDEAFGRLAIYFDKDTIRHWLIIVSDDEPHLRQEVFGYINEWFEDGAHHNSPISNNKQHVSS